MSQMPEDGSSPYGDLPYAMAGIRRKTSPYDRQRQYAYSLMQGGMDTSPVVHPMQGVSRLAQALVGGLMMNRADSQEAEATKAQQEAFGKAAQIADPNERLAAFAKLDPEMGMRYGAQMAMQEAAAKRKTEENKAAADVFLAGFGGAPGGQGGGGAADAIAGIESGGRYDAVGPETGKGRALGKFQVMSFNVGPWTKEVLGQEMTPEQFLASPQAQDAVFQSKFGQYVQKYGPGGAARAWFAGEGGMNNPAARDVLGTSVADYERKFLAAGGGQGGGLPVPQPPGAAPRPTEIPRPEPDPQLVQQVYSAMRLGKMTEPQAMAIINDDVNRRWQFAQQEAGADNRLRLQMDAEARREAAKQEAETRREANKPPTAEQSVSGGFADRMTVSNRLLQQGLENQGTNFNGRLLEGKVFGMGLPFANYAMPEDYRKYKQARDDFINAQLRRESGAAISDPEYERANQQYFPQPGDSAAVVAQKARNRALAVEGMIRNAGPNYKPSPLVGEQPQPGGMKDGVGTFDTPAGKVTIQRVQ